jgi:dolichol-phosphate mannosyltransferase
MFDVHPAECPRVCSMKPYSQRHELPFESMPVRPALEQCTVSVVLPVYNEAEVLANLCKQVHCALKDLGARREIIFVNDGSRDASPQILDQLAARYPEVRVVHFSRNFGHQAAVQAGLAHARGDAVILMDSDLQDSPRAILRFVAEWQKGYDVVYALRTERKEAWWKRALFNGFHRLLSSVATVRIPQDAGNFGLMDARVVRLLMTLEERDRYLPGLRSWVGFRQTGINVERQARYDKQPRVSLRGLWRLAKTAIFSFSSLPLTVFSGIGYSALALFFCLAFYALGCRFITGTAIPGWTTHVLTGSFFGALNALGISMLGEYAVRIYDQVRNRPLYLVDRVVNFHAPAPPQQDTPPESRASPYETRESQRQPATMIRREWSAAMNHEPTLTELLRESEELLAEVCPYARRELDQRNFECQQDAARFQLTTFG